ncbi:MAG: pseudouridylate synthase, partial [Planctomycetes bacterium]|nr:pseudouridylate synthase [Planctomycetota bacterium]
MAARGICSRRRAEELIEQGWVSVDGNLIREQGVRAPEDCVIEIDEPGRASLEGQFSIMLNKPVGIVSHLPQEGQRAAWQLLLPRYSLPAG